VTWDTDRGSWRSAVYGDPTYADAVLDRLVHNAHRIDLNGESLRRTRKPGQKPEPMALWTCRCAWTTQERCPHAHSSRRRRPSSRDLRLTTRLRRWQKPDSQNASRPGRHQIATVGEIISESWARSSRYTPARSSESALGPTRRFRSTLRRVEHIGALSCCGQGPRLPGNKNSPGRLPVTFR
jgi:IstB-like ATP binding protein